MHRLPEQRRTLPAAGGLVVFHAHHDEYPAQPRKVGIGAQAGVFETQTICRECVGNHANRFFAPMLTGLTAAVAGTVALIGSRGSKAFGTPVTFALRNGRFPTPRNVRFCGGRKLCHPSALFARVCQTSLNNEYNVKHGYHASMDRAV